MILTNKRIFIIEDNAGNLAIMKTLLEGNGASVAIERWGTRMVERMQVFYPIDIVLLDLMFPRGVTGYDVFDEIRSHAEFNHIPIVAVSASDPSESIQKTKAKGFSGFIAKPIDYDKFPRQIAKIIEKTPVWDIG